ncbi:MAG TPA: AraC family transcriptional regulator [Verrucomicrobiales bacterium]|nr:AraC family transcriptional regulator [Verrucomicrobiales bacterium]
MSGPASSREAFFRSMAPESQFYLLFNHLPRVSFFAKDAQFRFVAANCHFVERLGFSCEAELLGKGDFDVFPSRLAENFRRDDEEVLRSGEPKLGIVELFFNRQGIPDWFVTHKLPVLNRKGSVMGIMGIVRAHGSAPDDAHPHRQIERAVEHIRTRFREKITVPELAEMAALSPRQLNRKFVEAFGMSPQAVVMKVRIQAACELLAYPDKPVGEVAREVGFADQSSFTQQFHRHMGQTPLSYRRQFL